TPSMVPSRTVRPISTSRAPTMRNTSTSAAITQRMRALVRLPRETRPPSSRMEVSEISAMLVGLDQLLDGVDARIEGVEQVVERSGVGRGRPHRQRAHQAELLLLGGREIQRFLVAGHDGRDVRRLVEVGPVGLQQAEFALLPVDLALDRRL